MRRSIWGFFENDVFKLGYYRQKSVLELDGWTMELVVDLGSETELHDILYKIKRIFKGIMNFQKIKNLAPDIQELLDSSIPIFTRKFIQNPSEYPNVLNHVNRQKPKKHIN
ncbi:MAG: hypothetical protein ACTSRK_18515 [Promethearchaeota archaeon]